MNTNRSRVSGAALAVALFLGISSTTQAQVVVPGGAGAAIGGIAGGALGGAVNGVASAGGTASGALNGAGAIGPGGAVGGATGILGARIDLSGPSGTISGLSNETSNSGAPAIGFGSAAWSRTGSAAANLSSSALAKLEAGQQVVGQLIAVSASSATVRLQDGASKTYLISGEIAASLRSFIGKAVHLRSVDGVHISSVVGKTDVARGIVTNLNGNLATFVTSAGEIHTLSLGSNGVAQLQLRIGSSVVSSSNDFGKTARLSVLNISPSSALSDIYIGRVATLSGNRVVLGIGPSQQEFVIDGALSRTLSPLRGSTVAAYAADGVHVTSLISSPSLLQLVSAAHGRGALNAGRVAATVVATQRGRVTLQMPNGDLATYLTNPGNAMFHARVPVTVTPLDRVHVRVSAGAKVATLADAGLCVTVNSTCRGSQSGRIIAMSPTFVTVRLGNGDSRTFIGNIAPLAADAGVPVTVTQLDAVHASITANGRAAGLLDARACVTINAGCHAMPATVVGTGPSNVTIRLPNGDLRTLQGNPAPLGVSANVPIIVQPLDGTHAVLAANGNALQMIDASACVTVNAHCSGTAPTLASATNPLRAASAAADAKVTTGTQHAIGPVQRGSSTSAACVRLNAPGCTRENTGLTGGRAPSGVVTARNTTGAAASKGPLRTVSTTTHACATLNAPGCTRANTGTGTLAHPTGALTAGNKTAATGNGPVRTVSSAANACATLNTPGCSNGRPTGNGNATGNNGVSAAALANGCVSINGATCVASVTPGNAGAGGTNGPGNGTGTGQGNGPSGPGNGSNGPGNGIAGPGNGPSGPGNGSNGPGNGIAGPGNGIDFGKTPVTTGVPPSQLLAILDTPAACNQDGEITVNVSDNLSKQAIGGATVRLLGSDNPQWTTAANGTTTFFHLTTGTYRVAVLSPGYKPVLSPQFTVGCTRASSLQFRLARNARVRGAEYPGIATVSKRPKITAASIRLVRISSNCVSVRRTQTVAIRRVHRIYTTRVTRKHYFCSH